MSNLLEAQILTPYGASYTGKAVGVALPGSEGRFEVLVNHAPLMSSLAAGEVVVRGGPDGRVHRFAVSGGFVDVGANTVTVLAEAAESPESIDVSRAEAALERAKSRLAAREPGLDAARAEASLSRAMNRLRVAGR
jgi:F-type H+-transporting ATPase subunit epsilon